ncbi:MAG TPA: helix-turn-helix domain-containing protein [Puia sp.]
MTEKETGLPLDKTLLYIRNLDDCPPSYLYDPARKDFFEVLWLRNEKPLHQVQDDQNAVRGEWIYLIPPYRVHQLNKAGKKGMLLSFKRELLEEDNKEFALDVFKIFNIQGEFSSMGLNSESAGQLEKVYSLLEEEYHSGNSSFAILQSLLKVFLLHLIRIKEHEFTSSDINHKRVYEFLLLLEAHYLDVRNTDFYATRLGMSAKRLNQILKEKLNKTGMQLIHERLILEAKRKIIHSEESIKEIAWLLGFKERPYFSRFFKIHTGQTPEEFQKQAKTHIDTKSNTLVS